MGITQSIANTLGITVTSGSNSIYEALGILRGLGSNGHIWVPGANGAIINALASNNYLLSDGSTGYSTVDSVDGLMLDGMGRLGSELVTNGANLVTTTGWTGYQATLAAVSGFLQVTSTATGFVSGYQTLTGLTAGRTYAITVGTMPVSGYVGVYDSAIASVVLVSLSASGTAYFIAPDTNATINCNFTSGSIGQTKDFDNISVREFTGIHAKATNKPIVRRGAYNLLSYSEDFSNAAWVATRVSWAAGTLKLTEDSTASATHFLNRAAATVGAQQCFWVEAKPAGRNWIALNLGNAGCNFNLSDGTVGTNGKNGTIAAADDGYYRCLVQGVVAGNANTLVMLETANTVSSYSGDGTSGVYIRRAQLESGTTASDYTPTTTVAASNPSAGKYWLSFDGSNDSLLVGNIGFTSACTIIVAGRVNSLSAIQMLFAEDTLGVQIYIDATTGVVQFTKTGVSALVASPAATVVAGVPFVLTFRLAAGTAVIRNLGAQVATAATALTFSAATGARIGTLLDGTSYPLNGAIGHVIAIPQALTDAECLVAERYVASSFPSAPVF